MTAEPGWPPLGDYLRRGHGAPVAVERLGGMGGAAVWRVAFRASSAVIKVGARPVEAAFYRRLADPLRRHGVPIPNVVRIGRSGGTIWLVLEDVPAPLPPARRLADAEVLTALRRLYVAAFERPPRLPGVFRPEWSEATTAGALAAFPPPVAAGLAPLLGRLRAACLPLLRPACFISGDPNPTNWGVRVGGGVVLYDWERFGRGTPALDLAITVPGLGDADTFRLIAARYLDVAAAVPGPDPEPEIALARGIGLAKVWSVVEFLGSHGGSHGRGPGDRAASVADWLVEAVPNWLRSVYRDAYLGSSSNG